MDAKKAAKHFKPKYFADTKANATSSILALIGVTVSLGVAGVYALWCMAHPVRKFTDNELLRWQASDSFRIMRGQMYGVLPPTKEAREKQTPTENILKGAPTSW